jgi:hypothetical protein
MKLTNTNSSDTAGREANVPNSANAVLLQVHLWTGNTGPDGASDTDVPPPALAMAADLLQVRGGELCNSPAGSIAATFPDEVLAVNAARNLQRLVQGFSRAWQGGALGACTTLIHLKETNDGIDVGSLRGNQALKQAQPGQVVFIGGICDAARSIPGLEFRSIAGIVLGAAGKSGAPQQTLQLLPPLHMEGFVEEPFEASPTPLAVATEIAARPVPVEPKPPAYVLVSSPPSGKTAAVAPASSPASGSMRAVPVATDEIGAFSREEKVSGSGLSRWLILGGVAAVLVVGVLAFTFKKSSHPVPATIQQQAAPLSQEPATPTASVPSASHAPTPQPAASAKIKINDAAHSKSAPQLADTTPAPAPATSEPAPIPAPAPVEDIHPAHGLTFTSAEISSLIAHADKDSGNGNFDKAIQEYRLVLSREPSNDLAKRGLARALYNKEHK